VSPIPAVHTRRTRRRERGAILAAFAICMAAFFAFLPVAIDTGRLALTANEVQTVADAAAAAGARALLESGGSSATARSQGQSVGTQNFVNGAASTITTGQIEVGYYNPQTGTFSNGGTPLNAVRATPNTTVQNLFAGILGSQYTNTTVTKTATAAFSGLGSGQPTLPLALGECNYPSLQNCYTDPACLPSLIQVPNTTNNTGWTSFLDGSASNTSISQYMPSACGGTTAPPQVSVGTPISLNNGQITSVLNAVKQCVDQGINQFVVPIVSCAGNFNQSSTVTGFATIVVDRVVNTGSPKGLDLHAIFDEVIGPPGGGTYGTYTVRLYS
jgi:Flp pilus assembly protein TadG